jgi:hypothetical protein
MWPNPHTRPDPDPTHREPRPDDVGEGALSPSMVAGGCVVLLLLRLAGLCCADGASQRRGGGCVGLGESSLASFPSPKLAAAVACLFVGEVIEESMLRIRGSVVIGKDNAPCKDRMGAVVVVDRIIPRSHISSLSVSSAAAGGGGRPRITTPSIALVPNGIRKLWTHFHCHCITSQAAGRSNAPACRRCRRLSSDREPRVWRRRRRRRRRGKGKDDSASSRPRGYYQSGWRPPCSSIPNQSRNSHSTTPRTASGE